MSFETTRRNMAVAADDVETLFSALLAQFGEPLPCSGGTVQTIGAFYDDESHTSIYAASLERGNVAGIPLTDGRVAFRCLWQADLAAAYDAGEVPGVEQLSDEQLAALTVKEEL